MPPRNPLREQSQPQQQTQPETLTNIANIKANRLTLPDGTTVTIPVSEHSSQLTENGIYVDTEITHSNNDRNGTPMDPSNPERTTISHSGLNINDGESKGLCSARVIHPGHLSRTVKIGEDGQYFFGRLYCSRCMTRINCMLWFMSVLGLAAIAGVYKAFGWF